MKTTLNLPEHQQAVQLTAPDQLVLNTQKPVLKPGPRQILCRVDVVGLCFSDLKLLKQFAGHVRKSEVVSGIDPAVLAEIPTYVPGDKPTVPGHEPVVTVVAAGASSSCGCSGSPRWRSRVVSAGANRPANTC